MQALPDLTPWRQQVSRNRWRWLIRGWMFVTLSGFGALFSAWMALDVLIRLEPDHRSEAALLQTQLNAIQAEAEQREQDLARRAEVLTQQMTGRQRTAYFLAPMRHAFSIFPPGLGLIAIERDATTVRWQVQFAHVSALTAFERSLLERGFRSAAKHVIRQDALMTLTVEWSDD